MISVIIPVFNNSKTLKELFSRIDTVLDRISFEVIFINDGSRDSSLEVLVEMARLNNKIKVINFSKNFGQHPAIGAGFEHANGDRIVLMDADLQDQPENILELLSHLNDHVDICFTIKREADYSLIERITSTIFHSFLSLLVRVNVPRNLGTFRVFNRRVLSSINQYTEYNILYGPLMHYMGFNRKYIEVDRKKRPSGKSSYTFFMRARLAINALLSYSDLPHQASIWFGSVLFVLTSSYGFLVLIQYLIFDQKLPEGLTLITLLLVLLMSVLMVLLGILGTYVFRVYQEVLKRPKFLIRDLINFDEVNR